ncbi:uncharacterized protein MELLADRAFT_94890 [Melampsora larici-populina 98AG31]|uniref:Uncharacterized protein n=1 Tax=Melampsora larici-populina (strain 98AG31 / pathotype 3-4-7) TaxID=747676 RepID=F4S8A7_MELLP|nr:uncharacterized protein MELLADRAFT_94890 [Melampsora larici-populina 98AG31]EGF99061.1 hypothetical protein MELLADRAFT_94890 [Melampsora larici-populina 98AG31]
MLTRVLIVASTFAVLLSLIVVEAHNHEDKNHLRREADATQSFEKRTRSSSSPQRRAAQSHSSNRHSFSPVKRDVFGNLLPTGSGNHGQESFLHGLLLGVPDYNACGRPDGPIPPTRPGDAPFTQGRFAYEKAITCPNGIRNSPNGIVLLVPCTNFPYPGCAAAEAYAKGPFGIGLPRAGFDVCWVDLPRRSLDDIQLSAEFIAYAIMFLAPRSPATGGRISMLGYSQGGLTSHWTLNFWLSARQLVMNFVSIAGSLKGTTLSPLGCGPSAAIGGCSVASLQMSQRSRLLRALNTHNVAQVQTTSIFTLQDEIVFPQSDSMRGVSFLPGASNIPVQKACPGTVVDHFGIGVNLVAYGLALDALTNRRPASLYTFNRGYCGQLAGHDLLAFAENIPFYVQTVFRTFIGNVPDRVNKILKTVTTLSSLAEPKLQQYVCNRGLAPAQECTVGFCGPEERQNVVKGILGKEGLGGALNPNGNPLGQITDSIGGQLEGIASLLG